MGCSVLAAAGVAAPAQARPDLVVKSVSLVPPPGVSAVPLHMVVRPDGTTAYGIKAKVKNIGDRTAPVSQVGVIVDVPGHDDEAAIEVVDRLAPGETDSVTVPSFQDLALGRASVKACADNDRSIREADERNNCRTARNKLSLIAAVWKATTWKSESSPPTVTRTEQVALRFENPRPDADAKGFFYDVVGTVRTSVSGTTGGCAVSGSREVTRSPWPGDSDLFLAHDLTEYYGSLEDPSFSYLVTVSCPGAPPFNMPAYIQPLATYIGAEELPAMTPGARRLVGSGVFDAPEGEVTYTWRFDAQVPPP